MSVRMMIKCMPVMKSCILYFILFSSFSFLFFYFYSPNHGKFLELSIYGVYNNQYFTQHVVAGMSALMSISDGLGPSIFCRKMETARPMMEEMDGKVVYFPPESPFLNFDVLMSEVFFPLCTLTWRVNNYASRREKV